MSVPQNKAQSTRVKACTECRQQKLKCDASIKGYSEPCSRCRRLGVECVVTRSFRRVKRLTKSQLQAELDALREQVQSSRTGVVHQSRSVQELSPLSTADSVQAGFPQSAQPRSFIENQPRLFAPTSTISSKEPEGHIANLGAAQNIDSEITDAQNLQDLHLSGEEIDDCFHMFLDGYLHHAPIVAKALEPNSCYLQSRLLFWTIVAIGSRRYSKNPTLIVQLGPKVTDLAKEAIFLRDDIISTIQALILLCAWPMPFDSLGNDITPVLAGSMLQMSMIAGLHVYGNGQDFSRTKLDIDPVLRDHRTRIWAVGLTIYQRGHILSGTPGLQIPDTYDHEDLQDYLASVLPPSVYFQRKLSKLYVEAVLDIEKNALRHKSLIKLGPMIDKAFLSLMNLDNECPGDLDRFYLMSTVLAVLCLRFFLPSASIDATNLRIIYDLACSVVELSLSLDQQETFTTHGPIHVSRYLHLAACAILKIGRSEIRESVDITKGQKAYFSVIQLHKKLSVRSDDVFARSTIILTQLWTSKNVFHYANGSLDSLRLRFISRYGMSVVYDCYWWWRQEFAGQPDPYPCSEEGNNSVTNPDAEPLTVPETSSFTSSGWPTNGLIPESQWLFADDLMTDDWSQLQAEADSQFQQMTQLTPGWI